MANFTYKIDYQGDSKVIKRICAKLNNLAAAMLGTTHETAFYGDLGQAAYDHSLTQGNPHNLTLDDLGIAEIPREVEFLMSVLEIKYYSWLDNYDDVQFTDHDGNTMEFRTEPALLAWH